MKIHRVNTWVHLSDEDLGIIKKEVDRLNDEVQDSRDEVKSHWTISKLIGVYVTLGLDSKLKELHQKHK